MILMSKLESLREEMTELALLRVSRLFCLIFLLQTEMMVDGVELLATGFVPYRLDFYKRL